MKADKMKTLIRYSILGIMLAPGFTHPSLATDKSTPFILFSTHENKTRFILEDNMIDDIPDNEEFRKEVKTLFVENDGEGECITPKIEEIIDSFPELSKLIINCQFAKQISLSKIHTKKLHWLSIKSQAENLNDQLSLLKDQDNLQHLSIYSDSVTQEGIKEISEVPHLTSFLLMRHWANNSTILTPLASSSSLTKVTYKLWNRSSARTDKAIKKLNAKREKLNLPKFYD